MLLLFPISRDFCLSICTKGFCAESQSAPVTAEVRCRVLKTFSALLRIVHEGKRVFQTCLLCVSVHLKVNNRFVLSFCFLSFCCTDSVLDLEESGGLEVLGVAFQHCKEKNTCGTVPTFICLPSLPTFTPKDIVCGFPAASVSRHFNL